MHGKHTLNQNIERNGKQNSFIYSISHLFKEPKVKLKPEFTPKDVARHAAIKAQKRELRKQSNNDYRLAKLFRCNKHGYKIEKKLRDTNTVNLIHRDLSTKFIGLVILTYFKCTMSSQS